MHSKSTKLISFIIVVAIVFGACSTITQFTNPTATPNIPQTQTEAASITQTEAAAQTQAAQATMTAVAVATSEAFAQTYGIAIAATDNGDFAALAYHENGEQMIAMTETDSNGNVIAVTGSVWVSPDGQSVTIFNGPDGLPEKIVLGGFTIYLTNYTTDSVDAAVFDSTGEMEIIKGIEVDPDELSELISLQGGFTPGTAKGAKPASLDMVALKRTLKITSFVTSTAGCVAEGISSSAETFGASLGSLAAPCNAAIVSGVREIAEDANIGGDSTSIGLGVISCGSGDPFACATLILDTTKTVVESAQTTVQSHEADFQQAETAMTVIGRWALQYDWDCASDWGDADVTFTNDSIFIDAGDTWELPYSLNGDQITFTFENGTKYVGTVTGNYMEGSMTDADDPENPGCWNATRVGD